MYPGTDNLPKPIGGRQHQPVCLVRRPGGNLQAGSRPQGVTHQRRRPKADGVHEVAKKVGKAAYGVWRVISEVLPVPQEVWRVDLVRFRQRFDVLGPVVAVTGATVHQNQRRPIAARVGVVRVGSIHLSDLVSDRLKGRVGQC